MLSLVCCWVRRGEGAQVIFALLLLLCQSRSHFPYPCFFFFAFIFLSDKRQRHENRATRGRGGHVDRRPVVRHACCRP